MKKIIILSLVTLSVILVASCKKSSDNASNISGSSTNSDVRVETYTPQDITAISAICGGDAIVTQGLSLTEIGVCWGTNNNPTTDDYHWSTTNWNEPYICTLENLTPNVKYYIRAYALRGLEYYFGETKSFTTLSGSIEPIPEGAISGLFSVSDYKKIYFSKGNLQYQASTNTWRFAEHQWDYIGEDNTNISPSYNGWIDLFGFGTGNNPTNSSTDPNYYEMYNEWGANLISNGGNVICWRSVNREELSYLLDERPTTSGIRFIKCMISIDGDNSVYGVILLPDYWKKSTYSFNKVNDASANYNCNQISLSEWNTLEAHGAVFLPSAGHRYGANYYNDEGKRGDYWMCPDSRDYYHIYSLAIYDDGFTIWGVYGNAEVRGESVRLVQDK